MAGYKDMDIKQGLDYRYIRNSKYDNTGDIKYDYAREGILTKCLPKILFNGNMVLVTLLQAIDMRFIMLCKYIDKLKKFKYIGLY